MKKRFLSILLVLCMMLPLMPTTAHAVDSGICGAQGDNVTWTISDWNSSKALVLNGSGAMCDYSQEIRPSYSELSYETWNEIHCVIINDGITHIGNYAFYGLNNISEVILPSNAVSIGEYSFSTCSLTNLVIPGNVLSIGDSAFKNNLVLSNLTIQEGVRSIGPDAFARCFDLTSVLIPSSVTTLNNAFDQCPKLTSISVHGENPNYSSKDGVVFNKAQTSLLMYPGGKTDNPYIVPAGVEGIEPGAFMNCGQLKSLTLPDGFTTIGFNAFTWSGLTSITIPASITHIETSMECNYLKDVYYAGTKEEWNVIEGEKSWLTSATIHYGSTGPDDPGGDDPPSNEITFRSDDNFTVNVGDEITILASIPNAETLQKGDITWRSSNESVAVIESSDALISGSTASATAIIQGVAPGTSTITVSILDGRSAECTITVKKSTYNVKYGLDGTYSFLNPSSEIPYSFYKKFFGSTQARELHETGAGSSGQCYGMVITSMASTVYNSPSASTYGDGFANKLRGINRDWISSETGISASDYIKYGYIAQFHPQIALEHDLNADDLNGLYKAVKDYLENNGEPVLIGIWGQSDGKNGGHALWALGIDEDNDDFVTLVVYDCNYHSSFNAKQRTLTLTKENGMFKSWEYSYSDNYSIWGTGRPNAKIMYSTPTDIFLQIYSSNSISSPLNYDRLISTTSVARVSTETGFTGILSPDLQTDTDIILHIPTTSETNSGSGVDLYWANIDGEVIIETLSDVGTYGLASIDSGVHITIPQQSKATINVQKQGYNSVDLLLADPAFEIKYTSQANDGLEIVTLKGDGVSAVETNQIENGVVVSGVTNLTIVLEIEDGEITNKNDMVQLPWLNENYTYQIKVDDKIEKILSITADTNSDGKYDTPINWESNESVYSITFNFNGGILDTTVQDTGINGKLFSLPTPTRIGYTFLGWYTTPIGGTRITLDTVFDRDTTVYAQWTYDNSNIGNDTPYYPGGSGTGNGSNNGTSHSINTPSAVPGGKVTISPESAKKGDTVTITAAPDSGYELDYIKVADKNGIEVPLTERGNGKYIFTMPGSNVTLDYAFRSVKTAPPTQPVINFTDVSPDKYYYDAVAWAVAEGITNGASATTFGPNAPCTRGQIVTFLWRAAGSPSVSGNNPFTDVEPGDYWYDAVLWAVSKGITDGTSATTFSPNNICTRGQAVTFLYRNVGSPAVTTSAAFTDVVPGTYYSNAVAWALAKNITNGTTATTFSPDDRCSRGQIATFLYRNLGE